MTAIILWIGLVLGSFLGMRTEQTVQAHNAIVASGKLCEGESVTFHGADKTTTFTATKGTVYLKERDR